MPVNLSKGQSVNLQKEAPSLKHAIIGLGWEAQKRDGAAYDLDASAFLLSADAQGKEICKENDFIFYNNLKSADGSVIHTGDNRTGDADGDDEQIKVDLTLVPSTITKIAFVVTIDKGDERKQNFGSVKNAYVHLVDEDSKTEIVRYDLSEDGGAQTAMLFCELYRYEGGWKFKAVGEGHSGGLAAFVQEYGLTVA